MTTILALQYAVDWYSYLMDRPEFAGAVSAVLLALNVHLIRSPL